MTLEENICCSSVILQVQYQMLNCVTFGDVIYDVGLDVE